MEYYGRTLEEAVHNAVNRKQYNSHKYNGLQLQKKQRFDVPAPAKSWGVWVELWSQFGVTGPNRDNYQSIIGISYETISRGPSTFDVEIMGGDDFIRTVGGVHQQLRLQEMLQPLYSLGAEVIYYYNM